MASKENVFTRPVDQVIDTKVVAKEIARIQFAVKKLDRLISPSLVSSLGQVLAILYFPIFRRTLHWVRALVRTSRQSLEKEAVEHVKIMAILDKSSPYYQSAFRLCNYMRLTCELLAETEDLIMAARLHRLLLLRSTFQKIQEGRAELRDVLEARILAMNPKFHLFTSMAITEALAEYEKRSNSED